MGTLDETSGSSESNKSMAIRSDGRSVSGASLDVMYGSYEESEFDISVAMGGDASGVGGKHRTDEEPESTEEHPEGWDDLDLVDDVCLVGHVGRGCIGGPRYVEITVCSGAAEAVAPPSFAPDYKLPASTGSKKRASATGEERAAAQRCVRPLREARLSRVRHQRRGPRHRASVSCGGAAAD